MTLEERSILSTRGGVIASGYVALDVVVSGDKLGHQAGGTAANVAANLSFFGWASEVVCVVGGDPAGRHLRTDLARAGVEISRLSVDLGGLTPVVLHEVSTSGHRFRFGCPFCGRRFPRHRPLPADIARRMSGNIDANVYFFDRCSVGTLAIAQAVKEEGGLVIFEPATRGRAEQFKEAVELADIIKYSRQQLPKFIDLVPTTGRRDQVHILTNGPGGAAWRRAGAWKEVAGYTTRVVDGGGAGDWTTAAMLASLPSLDASDVKKVDFSEVLRVAQAVAALSCRVVGARGLSHVFSQQALRVAVRDLLSRNSTALPPFSQRLRRSRRSARCRACLSAADSSSVGRA